MITRRSLLASIGPVMLTSMAVDPDVVPLLDAKADRTSVTALEARVAAIEAALPGLTTDAEHDAALLEIDELTARVFLLEGGVVVPPPPPPPPPPPSGYAPPGNGIQVKPGDNIAAVIAAAPVGAALVFDDGLYDTSSALNGFLLKGGQQVWARTLGGATFDGKNVGRFLFAQYNGLSVSDVQLHGFKATRYASHQEGWGAVGRSDLMPGLIAEDLELYENAMAGIALSLGCQLRRIHSHHNWEYGISGSSGADGGLLEDCNVHHNNYKGLYNWRGDKGSGCKIIGKQITVRGGNWSDNTGSAVWFDNSQSTTANPNIVEDVVMERNAGPGIFDEISGAMTIRRNTIRGSGDWGSIYIVNSHDGMADGNTCEGLGVMFSDDPGRPRFLERGKALSNTLTLAILPARGDARHGLQVQSGRTGLFVPGIFDRNTYRSLDQTKPYFQWQGGKNWSQWRAAGQDPAGVLV